MSCYVDSLTTCEPTEEWPHNLEAHLYADTLAELHAMAGRLALPRSLFRSRREWPNYSLTNGKRKSAIALGAVEHSREDFDVWRCWQER